MTPILYGTSETAFTSNGLGRLVDCISCYVTEELNGIYECEFEYPINGKFYNEMVTNGGIISVTHDDNGDRQAFDIYKYSAPINGIVTFNARHISYRLTGIVVQPFTGTSCADAIAGVKTNSMQTNPFTFSTDKNVNTTYTLEKPMSARAILGGVEGSLLDVYGKGEYKFDNWNVYLYVNRGQRKGITVRYGKNITDFKKEHDESGVYNAIVPYWIGGDGTVVWLNDTVVATGQSLKWAVPKDFSDKFENAPTLAELRTKAENFLSDNSPWIPDENITLSFVQLWQSPDDKYFYSKDYLSVGDIISVYYLALGVVNENAKIIKAVYDVLLDRFYSLEIGKLRTTLAEAIIAPYTSELSAVQEQIKTYVPSSGGTFTGDVTFNGKADIKSLRSSATLSTAGWYRVASCSVSGSSIGLSVGVGSEQAIDADVLLSSASVAQIVVKNSQASNAISNIRVMLGDGSFHVDIQKANNASVTISVDLTPHGNARIPGNLTAVALTAVSSSGETELASISTSKKTAPLSSPTSLITNGTIANNTTFSYTAIQPCWFYYVPVLQAGTSGGFEVSLNGVVLASYISGEAIGVNVAAIPVPMQKGDVLDITQNSNRTSSYRVLTMRGAS